VKVIGIDPGTTRCGYSIVERGERGGRGAASLRALDYGIIDVRGAKRLEDQLFAIHEEVSRLVLFHKPDALAIERLYFNKNVKTALAVGAVRGVVILTGKKLGIGIFEYQPQQVKLAVTGYGNAAKDQVGRMTQSLLALPELPWPDDVSDALAIGICHLFSASSLLILEASKSEEVVTGYAAAVKRALEIEDAREALRTAAKPGNGEGKETLKRKRVGGKETRVGGR
jgi:crossover junction endodeoxyribonuclease RuvC